MSSGGSALIARARILDHELLQVRAAEIDVVDGARSRQRVALG